jgi:formate dehydrogenase-N alpha subunit
MTQHWVDIRNADVVMIIGSNAAENHPMAFRWIQKAMDNGGTFISVDPRFTRSSSKADIYARMRSGTDIAFIGGIINYAITNGLYNEKYVKECTNALFKINSSFETCAEGDPGVFSGLTGGDTSVIGHLHDATYNKATWAYQTNPGGDPALASDLNDPDCVFQLLKKQFAGYTKEAVCAITGTDPDVYEEICQTYCSTHPDDKSATIMYAMGTTQHTVGTQNVRSYAILQLLMGNIGVAGGGINALRGQDNVQGSTDMCILNHILPGYIKCPDAGDTDFDTFITKWADSNMIIEPVHSYTVNGETGRDPTSRYWWQYGDKYMASLIKAWWPAQDHVNAYQYLPKRAAGKDYSMLSIFDAMYHGEINGFICDGENPAVSDPDSNHVRAALANLDWMVVIDPFETETAAFWKRPGVTPSTINTTVYLLPAAIAYERAGSRSNSGRWAQWHWKAADPPGDAKDDLVIITELGQAIQAACTGANDAPIQDLNWPYFGYAPSDNAQQRAEKVAKEVNGYNMDGATPTTLVASFGGLANDGSTCSGNWLYCNQYVETGNLDAFEQANPGMFAASPGNRTARRYEADVPAGGPSGDPSYPNIGLHSYWSWCWPVNRRIIYNRASTYQSDGGANGDAGAPLAPAKYVVRYDWSAGGFKGDVPDGGWAPGTAYPFIMHKEGHGHLFGPGRVEGPFPWHYEPVESAVANPMGNYQVNPIIHIYDGALFGTSSQYPIAATTYRLTEHWHTGAMTRNLPWCNELQPEPFVEMSEELAALKGISNGDMVTVSSARGSIQVKACVTKRFKPFQVNGDTVHQVGVIWHWGYQGLSTGPSGNILTPFVGDANTRIQESKAFLVDIAKA